MSSHLYYCKAIRSANGPYYLFIMEGKRPGVGGHEVKVTVVLFALLFIVFKPSLLSPMTILKICTLCLSTLLPPLPLLANTHPLLSFFQSSSTNWLIPREFLQPAILQKERRGRPRKSLGFQDIAGGKTGRRTAKQEERSETDWL